MNRGRNHHRKRSHEHTEEIQSSNHIHVVFVRFGYQIGHMFRPLRAQIGSGNLAQSKQTLMTKLSHIPCKLVNNPASL